MPRLLCTITTYIQLSEPNLHTTASEYEHINYFYVKYAVSIYIQLKSLLHLKTTMYTCSVLFTQEIFHCLPVIFNNSITLTLYQ